MSPRALRLCLVLTGAQSLFLAIAALFLDWIAVTHIEQALVTIVWVAFGLFAVTFLVLGIAAMAANQREYLAAVAAADAARARERTPGS